VVENDITLEEGTRALLISGPNAGGKTVVLKTAGLASLMTAAGIPPPVSPGASVPMYTSVHTVFGDAQDLGGDLSSFSGHVMQINSIVDRADNLSLVLLDEIASDTDPREGAALAAAIIEELTARGATVLATSHFHELREWASGIPGVLNASVGFDLLRLKPSFRLEIGVSGESFALRVASGLGLPARIVEGARKFLGRAYVEGERILTTLKGREDELERSLGQARELEKRLAIEFEERRRALDAELAGARAQVEKDRESITTELKAMRDRAAGEISKLQKSPDMKSAVDTERWLSDVLRDIEKKRFPAGTESKSRAPSPGDRVDILTMGMTGTVESINLDRREASVVSSGKRLTVPLASIVLAENPREQPKPRDRQIGGKDLLKAISQARSHEQIQDEVDLRGMYTDEGVSELDAFLDASFRNDIDLVRIIHGHGTGALKMAVRDHLRRSDYVASSRPGAQNEGGDGVTVVTLKK
jgi:DNA mismatch repair protein MutS2